MGKSFRRHDIIGHGGDSEKYDKRCANRSFRVKIKRLMRCDILTDTFPLIREMSDEWCFNKDGKSWFGNLKSSNSRLYPHLPYNEDPYFVKIYRRDKSK